MLPGGGPKFFEFACIKVVTNFIDKALQVVDEILQSVCLSACKLQTTDYKSSSSSLAPILDLYNLLFVYKITQRVALYDTLE